MDKSKLRFPAALCFLLYLFVRLSYLVFIFDYFKEWGFDLYLATDILTYLAFAFITLGLLFNKPIISAAGIVGVLHPVNGILDLGLDLGFCLDIVFYVFLFIACLNRKNATVWCAIAAVSRAILLVLAIGGSAKTILLYATLLVGVLLLGVAFQTKKASAKPTATATDTTVTVALGTETAIEKLTKLKQLLDDGIITQEEFDAKKKQLLGM